MNEHDVLAERFEVHRPRLRALAYQTLGSTTEAEDAVQETWLRLSRSDSGAIENLGGWLTTVVARVCLNMLAGRRDEPVGMVLPEPVASDGDGSGPEHEALLADSIGPALLVILHTLAPAERLAFVLHDIFAVPSASSRPRTAGRSRSWGSRSRVRKSLRSTLPTVRAASPKPTSPSSADGPPPGPCRIRRGLVRGEGRKGVASAPFGYH